MTMKTTAYTRKITTNGTTRTTKTTGTTTTTEKTRTSRTTETTGTNSTTAATTGTTRATRTTGTKRANEITYTILKDSSTPPPPPPQLRAFFTKLNYNNTHYSTSKAKKQHNHYLNLEVNILFEFCYNALIFKILCLINSLKLLVHLVLSKTLHEQT